jgi:hypothetical protein
MPLTSDEHMGWWGSVGLRGGDTDIDHWLETNQFFPDCLFT